MKNKKITFFIGSISNKGGTERVTISIANELYKKGYNISIMSLFKGHKSYFNLNKNISLYSLYDTSINTLLNYPMIISKLRNFLKKEKIDILIDVDVILSLNSLPASWRLKTKIISWEHFNFFSNVGVKRRDWARKLAAKYGDKIITLTNEDKEYYQKYLKLDNKADYIYNPTPFENVKKSFCESKIAISIGRLAYQKGFDKLLNIWKIIEEKDSEWELYIIGSGEGKEKLFNQKETLGLKRVKFIEHIDNIEEYYKKASLYLMTSRFEGLPMTLIEAQSFGLPIISYDIKTGPKDIVENGINGYLIENDNEKEFIENFLDLVTDREKLLTFSGNAYKNTNKFKIEKIIERWEEIIKLN